MSLSFNEVRQYVIGLLQNYFPNKKILNKIGEDNGSLTYDGSEIKGGGSSPLTEEEMQEIKDQLSTYSPPVYAVADPLTNSDMEEIKQSMAMHCKQPFPVEQHRYSLNEQKVGEWIDSSPIYEKTFHIEYTGPNSFSMNGEHLVSKLENASEYNCWWTQSSSNLNFYVKVKPDNIGDIMIIKDIAFIWLSNGYKSPFSSSNNSSNVVQFQRGFQLAEEPNKPVIFISTPWNINLYWTDAYITVRYTKQEV
jgi:hypothetical protein